MKIMDNGVVRDMTPEEEAIHNAPCPAPWDDIATEQDYQNALNQMGVSFDENA